MRYFIAIDGGGTKTESVLFSEEGQVLERDITQGVNALDVGIELSKQRVAGAVERLMAKVPEGGELTAVYGGLAACVDYFPGVMHRHIAPICPGSILRLEGDGGSLIAAMQGHSDGASLIAGTGSSMYIRNGDQLQRYGGWGPQIDTEGSGFKLGLHAFYSAFRSFDGRGPKTILYELIAQKLGDRPENCLPEIYAKGRPFISLFAQCVFDGRKQGDAEACRIFDHGVKCLAELVEIGERVLDKEFCVFTGGGLFSNFPEYWEALRLASPKRATLIPIDSAPIYGAAAEALWDAGINADALFKQKFMDSYRAIVEKQDSICGGSSLDFSVIYKTG